MGMADAAGPTKVFSFVCRREGLSRGEFLERWRDEARRVADTAQFRRHVSRYVHNEPLPDAVLAGFSAAHFDGVAEAWFDDARSAETALAEPVLHSMLVGGVGLCDPARGVVVAAEEALQFDHGWGEVKFVGLSRRGAGFGHDEWCRYWVEVHGPLAYGVPEFARYYGKYVHNYVMPNGLGPIESGSDYDGIVEEWLRTAEDFARCQQEPQYLEIIRPDEQRFVDITRSHFLLVRERAIL